MRTSRRARRISAMRRWTSSGSIATGRSSSIGTPCSRSRRFRPTTTRSSEEPMRSRVAVSLLALYALGSAVAQEPVVASKDPESLFTDADPAKHANKQVVLHILRELVQCNYWEQADRWLTERYLQHNPNVTSGRDNVVQYFAGGPDRKSTRLNSSHLGISY